MFSEGLGGTKGEHWPEISLFNIADKGLHLNISFYPLRSRNPVILTSGVFGERFTLVGKTNPKPILRLFAM